MKILWLILGLLGASTSVWAADPLETYALSPTFHYIQLVKMGAGSQCELDAERSIDFSMPFGLQHATLKTLELNIYPVEESGGQNFRKIEFLGFTFKNETIKVTFVTTKTATDWLTKRWTQMPKRKWFTISTDNACISPIDEPFQVSGFSVEVK